MTTLLIVHGGHELYGSDRSCLRIAEGLGAAGWTVEVLLPRHGPLAVALTERKIPVHVREPLMLRRADLRGLRAAAAPLRWAVAAVGLWRFARARRFDLVHSNVGPVLGGWFLARRWRVAHVWHLREVFTQPAPVLRGFRRLLGTAEIVVANSRAVAAQFDGELGRRIRVVHSGVDVPAPAHARVPLSGGPATLVCVGRLNAWKGQDVLVEAVALLRERGLDVRLRLVGDVFAGQTQYRDRLERLVAQRGLGGVVELLGERADALELVAAADIAVLPSRVAEPFGRALVEAMALGRPVVATDGGGPAEVVRDGVDGRLVALGDPVALADALGALLADPAGARAMGERARQRAGAFSGVRMVAEMRAVYEQALRRAR